MTTSSRTERIAYGLALLRGGVLVVFALALAFAPDDVMPGTAAEPARTLGLMFASRTILLGAAFIALALRRRAQPLAWVFVADATLMLFETVLAIATNQLELAIGGIVIGGLEVWAGRALHRASSKRGG